MADLKVFVIVLIILVVPAILQKCDERKDVVFLVDSSGSVKSRNFEKVRSFLVYFVQKLDIGESKIRLSVVRFSSVLTKILWLDESFDKTEITNTIKAMRYNGGGTKTGEALGFANQNVLNAANGDREEVPDLVFVITDGKSKVPHQTQSEAKLLHDKGVDVVAIGVGKGVEDTELLNIASDKDFALKIDNFDQLKNETLHKRIFTAACTGLKPTTPIITTTELKQEVSQAIPSIESSTGNNEELTSTNSIPTEQSFKPPDDTTTMTITQSTYEELTSTTTIPPEQTFKSSDDTTTMTITQSIYEEVTSTTSIPTEQTFKSSDDTTMTITQSTLPVENMTSFDSTFIGREQVTSTEEIIIDDSTSFETNQTSQTIPSDTVTDSNFDSRVRTVDTTASNYPDNSIDTSDKSSDFSVSNDALSLFKDWKTVAGLTAFSGLVLLASMGGIFWAVRRKMNSNSQEIKQYD